MNGCCLALDIGGSFVKVSPVGQDCAPLLENALQVPVNSAGSAHAILGALRAAAAQGRTAAEGLGCAVETVGVSIPGPFDYFAGVSHMTHKFAAIRDMPLVPVLAEQAGCGRVTFLHDSTAFMLGECFFGAGRGAARPVGVMLGTGFGFGVMQDGRICVNARQTPALSLWGRAFREGITEDYVSTRAIRARYAARRTDGGCADVREIAGRARAGDAEAAETMAETGALLAEILLPHVTALHCDRVVLGGQIARSADLLLPALTAGLPVPVVVAQHLDHAALLGAALYAGRDRLSLVRETAEPDMLARAKEGK